MIRYIVIWLLLCLWLPLQGAAQTGVSQADRYLRKAALFMGERNLRKAELFYKKAMAAAPHVPYVYSVLGKYYYDEGRYMDAAYIFESGAKSCTGGAQIFAIPLSNALFRAGNAEKAGAVLRGYHMPAGASPQLKEEVQRLQRAIDFGRLIGYHKYTVGIENMGDSINSADDDYFPSYSSLRKDLVFTRRTAGLNEDFYYSALDSCMDWSGAKDMGFPLNSPNPECAQVRSYNGRYMIYQKCDNRSPNGWEMGGCDLYLSYAAPRGWSVPRPFGYTINTTAFEGMPALSADESALYFVSDRPGGYGGKDIWVSYFKDGYWQVPENLGPQVNTEKDELTPVIAADGKTLYFASKGHSGFGGYDMFVSRIQPDGQWGKAMNMGTPLNSPYDELCGTVPLSGRQMYFSSDRPGGLGGQDIYLAELPADFRPELMAMLYGQIQDWETGNAVSLCEVKISDPVTGTLLKTLKGNRGDGSFYYPLPAGQRYALQASHIYYQPYSDTVHLAGYDMMDTLRIRIIPEGYMPAQKKILLMSLDGGDTTMLTDDSFCLALNRALIPYSGKITGIELNAYLQQTDSAWLYDINPRLKSCLFKIGITEEYISYTIWDIAETEPAVPETKQPEGGRVEIILEYTE